MHQRGKMVSRMAGVAVVLVLTAASAAWACTGQPRIYGLSSTSGAAGTAVTMSGSGAVPNSPVEIRWNGVEGTKLAETTADGAGQFSAVVRVPSVAPGTYTLTAVSNGTVARHVFDVAGAASPASAPDRGFAPAASAGLGLIALGMAGLLGGIVTSRRRIDAIPA